MPGPDDGLGKKAETKIKQWLDHPEDGQCLYRIVDQMSGFYGSRNICDFFYFKSPYCAFIESKSTWHDRFDFSMISENQFNGLLEKSKINNVYGLVIVLFATYKRAFILNIEDIDRSIKSGNKSLNIKKLHKWKIPSIEIATIPSRKSLLDYKGELFELINQTED